MDQHDLADRLNRLERENRRLRRIGALVLIGIVAVVVMGQTKSAEVADVVRARRFEVVNEKGLVRASLGQGELVLYGTDAMDRIRLTVRNGAQIRVIKNLENRATLGVDRFAARLELLDRGGRIRTILGMPLSDTVKSDGTKEQNPGLILYDKAGEIIFLAPAIPENQPCEKGD